jgi:hypothetical protein
MQGIGLDLCIGLRVHSTLGYLSHVAYEAKLTVKEPICLFEVTCPLHKRMSRKGMKNRSTQPGVPRQRDFRTKRWTQLRLMELIYYDVARQAIDLGKSGETVKCSS